MLQSVGKVHSNFNKASGTNANSLKHRLLMKVGLFSLISAGVWLGGGFDVSAADQGARPADRIVNVDTAAQDKALSALATALADRNVPAADAARQVINFVMDYPGHDFSQRIHEEYREAEFITWAALDDFTDAIEKGREKIIGNALADVKVREYWRSSMIDQLPASIDAVCDTHGMKRLAALFGICGLLAMGGWQYGKLRQKRKKAQDMYAMGVYADPAKLPQKPKQPERGKLNAGQLANMRRSKHNKRAMG